MKVALQAIIILVTALCAGGLVLQASLNGALARQVDSSIISIFISFATGSLFLVLLFPLPLNRYLKRKDLSVDEKLPPVRSYMVLAPSTIGLAYVTAGTVIGPILGFNLFFVCIVSGQVAGSICVDHIGFFVPKVRVTLWRMFVGAVVLAGSIISVLERLDVQGNVGGIIGLCLVSIGCGVLLAVQPPINAEFTRRMRTQPNRTALVSFFFGSCAMAVVWGILALVDPPESRWEEAEAWMYFGGPLGASYVVASILFAPIIGVANFFVAVIFGQLFFSTIIDVYGLFGFEVIPLTVTRLVGVVLVFCGVVGFKLSPCAKSTPEEESASTSSVEAQSSDDGPKVSGTQAAEISETLETEQPPRTNETQTSQDNKTTETIKVADANSAEIVIV